MGGPASGTDRDRPAAGGRACRCPSRGRGRSGSGCGRAGCAAPTCTWPRATCRRGGRRPCRATRSSAIVDAVGAGRRPGSRSGTGSGSPGCAARAGGAGGAGPAGRTCARTRAFTGWDADGGYAELAVVPEAFAYRLPDALDDVAGRAAAVRGHRRLPGVEAGRAAARRPAGDLRLRGVGARRRAGGDRAGGDGARADPLRARPGSWRSSWAPRRRARPTPRRRSRWTRRCCSRRPASWCRWRCGRWTRAARWPSRGST